MQILKLLILNIIENEYIFSFHYFIIISLEIKIENINFNKNI